MLRIYTSILVVLFSCTTYSQVGIGTTNPDPSALLELDADDQGFLTPRMTTALRTSISSPAEGLLVFDTDEDVFYYFDGTNWLPIDGAVKRDNYKLVKSITDLADEFTGTVYELDENFMYEINGTISVDYPIDLNGAYLRGHDTGEDILLNNSGSTLFVGSDGGRMKDLLILGNNEQVFDFTGSGTENVILYSIVISGASSVGTFTNLNTVYFEVLQITSSGNGITASNINNFYLDKGFYEASNEGTYIKLTGTFNNVQLANGRVVVDDDISSPEIGIDVSDDPTINISASLSEISFAGDGIRVEGYTNTYSGYNFTNKWDVNCPGILNETDDAATGDLNFNFTVSGGASTTFSSNQVPVKLNGTTTSNSLFRFLSSGNNRIVYDGKDTRYFNVTASISFEGNTNQDRYIFYVAKGNSGDPTPTVLDRTGVWRRIAGAFDISAVPLIGVVELSPGDYIEVWAERFSGSGSLFTVALNLSIR